MNRSLPNPMGHANQQASIEQAQEILRRATSRDYTATMDDVRMTEIMAQSWKAWDQFFNTIQREMSRYPTNESDAQHLNVKMVTLSDIIHRAIEFVDQGNALIANGSQTTND